MIELPSEDAWWTAAEFAAQLHIKPRWLEERCMPSWPEAERLPHQRVGRALRFSREDREAIKTRLAQGPRTTPVAEKPIDLAAGLRGLAKLRKLQGATP